MYSFVHTYILTELNIGITYRIRIAFVCFFVVLYLLATKIKEIFFNFYLKFVSLKSFILYSYRIVFFPISVGVHSDFSHGSSEIIIRWK